MPDLEHIYLDYDLTLLKAVAEQAGVELNASNARAAALELATALKIPDALDLLLTRVLGDPNLDSLPEAPDLQAQTRLALEALIQAEGRLPAPPFIRRFGEPRPLGPAALARERPWESPLNAGEALYFNGLMGRAFMETDSGPQEFFFIPNDLLPLLPQVEPPAAASPAEAVAPSESASAQPASSALVDDVVTVLAAIQLSRPLDDHLSSHLRLPALDLCLALLADLNLLLDHKLNPEPVKEFLRASRGEQLRRLAEAWRDSKAWNDLWHVPTLRTEPGAWSNDPVATRAFVIRLCADLPAGEWRSLESFVGFVREHHPDFQRPAGDYDSWYIRDAGSGEYLRGFEHWDKVDGALLRYLIRGPLHWLGLVDKSESSDAFRLTPIFEVFTHAGGEWKIADKPKPMIARGDGVLLVSRSANRYDRFQAARIGEWLAPGPLTGDDAYSYRLTGNSLQVAARQGITARHITAFLRRACEHVPKHLIDMVERWGRNGIEVRAAQALVLRVSSPEVLETLRRSPQASRHLGETLGPTAVEVKNWEKLREAMAALGLAAELQT
ncbi:MAG: helicase-associated domain-containing protein [Chloroflexi bacterium]|nr:helicase-associated domain-containing protein [Chloroflexota bacterium]